MTFVAGWLTLQFPGESPSALLQCLTVGKEHLAVGSKEMMAEAKNDCYFSPADRYTPLAEMIQQFKVESCETL